MSPLLEICQELLLREMNYQLLLSVAFFPPKIRKQTKCPIVLHDAKYLGIYKLNQKQKDSWKRR